jgi:large-conductance mechanosensitive channel
MAKANHAKGFVDFVREQGVVGLAVGLAIGAAAGEAVKQIVEGLINWGAVISAVIVLLATAFVVYQIVHIAKLDRLDKKKD